LLFGELDELAISEEAFYEASLLKEFCLKPSFYSSSWSFSKWNSKGISELILLTCCWLL
jgi:hypothetical protein